MEVNIYKIIKINVAISGMQAEKVKKEINYDAKKVILNFKEITDVTTAFMNVLLDGFYPKLKTYKEILDRLKIKHSNPTIKFAFGDAFKLFKKRYEK